MFRAKDYGYKKIVKRTNSAIRGTTTNSVVANLLQNMPSNTYSSFESSRTPIDRLFDSLSIGQYVSAGIARGLIPNNDISVWEGISGGIKASQFLGKGYEKGEHTYSKVFSDLGWNPTTVGGKVARGVAGFAGDVLLDPTTYLGGGALKSLVKGTGKAGVKATHQTALAIKMAKEMGIDVGGKVVADLPNEVYKKFVKKFADNPNINKDLVERLATKKATDVAEKLSKVSEGLTSESAQKIVLQHAEKKGVTLSADEVARESQSLVKNYNRTIGLRDEADNFDFKLGNTLLGNKLYGKNADKGFTLAKGTTLQKIGDKTIAPQYAKLRDSIYGGRLGKLFSTKSTLYNLSKESPEEVYDFLKFVEHERIATKNSNLLKRTISDKAKAMNLTNDERTEVIKMVEDKSRWVQVQKAVKLVDTEEAKSIRSRFNEKLALTQAELDKTLDLKKTVDSLGFANESELFKSNEVLNELRKEYKDSLKGLNISHITDRNKIKDLIKAYGDEIDNLKKEEDSFAKLGGNVEKKPEDIVKMFDEYSAQPRDARTIDKGVISENISQYLYGRPDYVSPVTWDTHIKKIVDMIKNGDSKEMIIHYADKNSDFFSGKAQTIYPFIAEQMKYGDGEKFASWKEMYYDRVTPLRNKLVKNEALTEKEERLFVELQQLKLKRDAWVHKFRKTETTDGIKKIITDVKNKEMWDDYKEIEHMANTTGHSAPRLEETRRQRMINNDFATDTNKMPTGMTRSTNKTNEFVDKNPSGKLLTSTDRAVAYDDLVERMFFSKPNIDPNNLRASHVKWANAVTNEVEPLLKDFFKMDFTNLSVNQKELLYNMAIQNAGKRVDGAKLVGGVGEAERRAIAEETKRRAEKLRVQIYASKVKEGSNVEFKLTSKPFNGVIKSIDMGEDGKMALSIMKENGTVVNGVKLNQLTGVRTDAKLLSADEIIKMSNVTEGFVTKQNDLNKLIDVANENLGKLDVEYKTSYSSMLEGFKTRANTVKDRIKTLESTGQELGEAFKSNDSRKIRSLSEEIKKLDNALTDDDAYETYIRSWLGDGEVDDIISKNTPKVAMLMLDSNENISDKVVKIARQLHNDLAEIGLSEVAIGKLDIGQFEEMTSRYLPHVLTEAGAKLFDNIKDFTDSNPQFGSQFNQFSMERTIKSIPDGNGGTIINPNILEINKYFKEKFGDILQGKNVFSEDVADIYLTRALKNVNLVYDNKYMDEVLDMFGKDYTGEIKEGYNVVMNHSKYRETASSAVRLHSAVDISEAVTEHLKDADVMKQIKDAVYEKMGSVKNIEDEKHLYKKLFNDEVGSHVEKFIKENYTDEVKKDIFKTGVKNFSVDTKSEGFLDELSVPLVEFNQEQIDLVHSTLENSKTRYFDNIREKLIGYEKSNYYELNNAVMPNEIVETLANMDFDNVVRRIDDLKRTADDIDIQRLNRLSNNIDTLTKVESPQVKQVNSAIVQKSNEARKLQIQKDNNNLLQIYDKFTHFIKLNQTTVLPSFHIRNKFSNTFNNWLEIGSDAVDVDFQKKAFHAIKNGGKVDGVLKITREDGSIGAIEWRELYDVANEYNVIGDGFFKKDLGTDTVSKGLFKKLPLGLDPTDTENFKLYKLGASIGSTVEDHDRLIHFASQVSRGMSFEDSARSVEKALFDYSDLTTFEKSVMKRIIPYYTWLRKNSALQLEAILEHPKKYSYLSKVLGGVEGMVDEEDRIDKDFVNDFAKDWIQTPLSVMNPDGRKEPVLWNPNLPYMDLGRIPDPLNPKQSLIDMFTQSNPIIKTPIELLANRNMFFEQPIVDKEDNPVVKTAKRADHVLSQLALYGTGKGFVEKSGTDALLHTLNSTSGVKLLSYDYDAYKAMKLDDMRKNGYEKDSLTTRVVKGVAKGVLGAGGMIVDGFKDSFSQATNSIANSVNESRPTKADDYTGALRPISQSKYERLSDKDKLSYVPPTEKEAFAYNKKAVELEQQALEKTGVAKKFVWSLFDTFNLGDQNKEYQLGEIVKVTDGDTFNIKIGNKVSPIRMLLIDTPETVDPRDKEPMPYGKEASNYGKKHLLGKDAKIYFDGNKTDIHGRTLGYVEIDGVDMNNKMLEEGLAQIRFLYQPHYDRLKKYQKTEEKASKSKKGLWSLDGYATPGVDDDYDINYQKAIKRMVK